MSIMIKCVITVENQKYEAGTDDMEIFSVSSHGSSTGTFAGMDRLFLQDIVEVIAKDTVTKATNKLIAMKGKDGERGMCRI